jgi:cysteine desulfurase
MGKAAESAVLMLMKESQRLEGLRNLFEAKLKEQLAVLVTCEAVTRLPNTSHIRFDNIKTERLISALPMLAFTTGSACSSALPEPSHVLTGLGFTEEESYSSARFSFGRFTMEEDILTATTHLIDAVSRIKSA